MFHYHCGDQWHQVPITKVYTQIIEDLDSVGFEIRDGALFETSNSNKDVIVNIGIVDAFAFTKTPELTGKKARKGAWFPYLLKQEYQTPLLISTLERLQIFVEHANISFDPSQSTASQSELDEYQQKQYEKEHRKWVSVGVSKGGLVSYNTNSTLTTTIKEVRPGDSAKGAGTSGALVLRCIDNRFVWVDKNEPLHVDNCFIHAIKQQGASEQMVYEIRLPKGKSIELKDTDIDRIAKAFNVHVIIHDTTGYKHNERRCYGVKAGPNIKTYRLVRYLDHYFTNEQTHFTKYYIDNMDTLPTAKHNHIKEGNRTRRATRDKYYLNTEELVTLLYERGAFRKMTVAELIQYKAYDN
jgi:hypothetical protein